jgi:hypothetical protein
MSTIIMLLALLIVIKYRMKDLSPIPKTAIEFGHLIIKVR